MTFGIDFRYEDAQNTVLIYIPPSETVEIPSNVVRIKDSEILDHNTIKYQPLIDLKPTLKYLSFHENSKLESLGISTFYNFTNLISVDLSNCNQLTSLEVGVFCKTSLTNFKFPTNSKISIIKMAAFQSTKLTSIDIPKSLLYVDNLDDSTF